MSAERYLLDRLRVLFRDGYGLRHQLPAYLEQPYRGTTVDLPIYYHRHSAKDDLNPVVGYRVPDGHFFVLDSVSFAANIFQSPSFLDFFNCSLYLRVNGVRSSAFASTGSNNWTRAQQVAGPGAPTGTPHDRSPILYTMNDLTAPGLVSPQVNPLTPADPITRTMSGHSPAFGLQHAAEGPHAVFRGGDLIEVVYEWIRQSEVNASLGIDGRLAMMNLVGNEAQIGCVNIGRPTTIFGIGVPAGAGNVPNGADDGGLFGTGSFSGAGTPLLAIVAGLTDGIYQPAGATALDLAGWGGGEQLGVDLGDPNVNGVNFATQPYTTGFKNVFYVFLDRPSSQDELDAITWRVGASTTNAVNQVWDEMRVDDAIYREVPRLAAGLGGPVYWYEIRFTNNAVGPWANEKGWPLSSRLHRYVKVQADSIAPGVITAPLQVTEVTVGYEVVHRIAGRFFGWSYVPEFDNEKESGTRVG